MYAKVYLLFNNFTFVWDHRVHQTKGRSWRTDCPLVLVACHKFGQGNRVRNLHEFSKSVHVGEGQGRIKTFSNFLCIWTDKEQVLFILYLPQVKNIKERWPSTVQLNAITQKVNLLICKIGLLSHQDLILKGLCYNL